MRPPANLSTSRTELYFRGLAVQARVIGALIMRELHTRYGRENVGYLWMILEPMTLASAIAVMHASEKSQFGSDIQPVPFAIVGYILYMLFRSIFSRAEGTLESNRQLLYHRMVTIFDMLVSRSILEAASILVTMVILLGFAISIGYAEAPYRPLWLLFAFFMMVWFSTGLAMICCAVTHDNRTAGRLVHPITYLMLPLSGAFYVMKWIPLPYRDWLWFLPLTQIFEMARYGQFASAKDEYFNVPYLIATSMITTYIGLLWIKIVRRHVHLS